MLMKLELSALQADLANIDRLISKRSEKTDPIGFFQLTNRRAEVLETINKIQENPERSASVALFFGGGPVLGSKGINADFAGKAIEAFQDLVSKRFANIETGILGTRGPVPLKANTELMLTDVARGSFGLVLEEIKSNESLSETAMQFVVDEVAQTIVDFSSPDEDRFETALATVDSRSLISLRDFFRLLDEQHATLRVVEGERDAELDFKAVKLARERTDFTEIDDKTTDEIIGRLYILPAHRRFELELVPTSETLYGSISAEFSKENLNKFKNGTDVVGKIWRTKMRIRKTVRVNQQPKLTYTLMGLIEEIDNQDLLAKE